MPSSACTTCAKPGGPWAFLIEEEKLNFGLRLQHQLGMTFHEEGHGRRAVALQVKVK